MTDTHLGGSAALVSWRMAAIAPFPCLALATVIELVSPDGQPRPLATLLLTLVTASWLTAMPWSRHATAAWRACYVLGLLGLMLALMFISDWFSLVAWAPMVQSFALFALRWAFFAAVGTSVAMSGVQLRGTDPELVNSYVIFGVNLLVPLIIAGWALGRESQSRRELIWRLRTAMADNDSLQQQLVEQAHATGVEQERHRLSREIHDTLAQSMSAITTQLESALHSPDDDWRARAAQARDTARDGLAEARRSVRELGPASLSAGGLAQALAALASRPPPNIEVRFECVGDPVRLDDATETALLRVAREAQHNAAKHSQASLTCVTLSFLDDEVLLDVRDNGVGIDTAPASTDSGGHGIPGMRQRMRQIQGRLNIETSEAGTAVCAAVPISSRETV